MRTSEQHRAAITEELAALREYRAMPQTRMLLALLDALAEDALHSLATVTPEKLGRRQGAYAQLVALREALGSDDPDRSPIVT